MGPGVLEGFKGIPKCFLAKWFVGGLGCQGKQTTHFQEHFVFVCLAAEGGQAPKPFVSGKVLLFGLGTPGLRDPF